MSVSLAAPAGAHARTCDRVASPHGKIKRPKTLVHKLKRGQVGCLHAGVYRHAQVVITKPGITLRSYPGERATWFGRIVIAAPRVTLRNLDLDGRTGPPCHGGGCYPREDVLPSPTVNGPRARLIGNDISNPRGICINIRRYYRGLSPRRFLVQGNRIHNCRPATNHIHGIYVGDGSHGIIRDNVIYDNGDKGIVLYPNARDVLVEHNTIDGNRTGVHFGGSVEHASNGNIVRANVLTFPTPRDGRPARFNVESHWDGPVGSGNLVTGNCLYTRSGDDYFKGKPPGSGLSPDPVGFDATDNVVADPVYANRSADDFRIDPAGPCASMGADSAVSQSHPWAAAARAPRGLDRALWWRQMVTSLFGPYPYP
jgi:parallel beta-helix repeat protein